jgi:hypothetical protein
LWEICEALGTEHWRRRVAPKRAVRELTSLSSFGLR